MKIIKQTDKYFIVLDRNGKKGRIWIDSVRELYERLPK